MLEIKEILFHPIQLLNVELINLQLSKNTDVTPYDDTHVTVGAKSWSEVVDSNKGNMYLSVQIRMVGDENDLFSIEMTYKGSCRTEAESITNEDMKNFLEVQSVKLLWPYLRETVVDVMNKMGLKPLVLPTVDVLATMKKATTSEVNKANEQTNK